MIRGVHHIAIATPDLPRFVDHYARWFGFEHCATGGWDVGNDRVDRMLGLSGSAATYAMIRLGNLYIEVFQFAAPLGTRTAPRMCDPGFTHLCLYCDDVHAEYERLLALGMEFNCPPGGEASTRATYGRDCDGNVVELLQIVDPSNGFAAEALRAL